MFANMLSLVECAAVDEHFTPGPLALYTETVAGKVWGRESENEGMKIKRQHRGERGLSVAVMMNIPSAHRLIGDGSGLKAYVGWSWLLFGLSRSSPVAVNHCLMSRCSWRVLRPAVSKKLSQVGCMKQIYVNQFECVTATLLVQFHQRAFNQIHIQDILGQFSPD